MTDDRLLARITRRRMLAASSASVAGLAVPSLTGATPSASASSRPSRTRLHHRHGALPAEEMQKILRAEGSVSSGVLGISIERADLGAVRGPQGVAFPPSFQINGDLTFQPLGDHLAFFNGDLALKASELNPVVDAIHARGLTFQAMHQHYFDLDPMVWFVHFRGIGGPIALAHAVRHVLTATSTPLPQTMPTRPTPPLDDGRLARTLHGSGEVGGDGVVTITVPRNDRIVIGDVEVSPETNVSTNIQFLPLDAGGARVAAAPDFSLAASEITPVVSRMRASGFEVHCLYNQETTEQPQLYFSHMIEVGEPQALAVEMRKALDDTNAD